MSNNIELNHCLFWLYYAKGLLEVKLKQYNDSINSFAASLDSKNYSRVLVRNTELAQEQNIKLAILNRQACINRKVRLMA